MTAHSVGARDALGARPLAAWAVLAIGLLVALRLWQGDAYWEYSDGVYALTGRLVLHGASLYRDVAAAQPPPMYYAGAGILAFGDDVGTLRAGLSVVALATSLLVLVCVWRLTRLRWAAVAAGLLALLTPWALREHAQLVPETFGAPLLLGAALAASRSRGAAAAGALAAAAVAFKLAFAVPALAVLLAAQRRGRALLSAAVVGVALACAFALAFGEPLLDGAVRAQRETGSAALHYVGGLWAQAGWNLLPLLACAALAWPARRASAEPALLRALAAAAAGALLLLPTLFKHGSYLTVVVVAEPPLLSLAALGVVAAAREWAARPAPAPARAPATAPPAPGRPAAPPARAPATLRLAVAVASAALAAVQVGSLVVAPGDPGLFTRPLARSGPAWTLSPQKVRDAAAGLRACPPDVAASTPPYVAFVAGRRVPGDQPDQFIVANAPRLARFRAAAARDQPRCP